MGVFCVRVIIKAHLAWGSLRYAHKLCGLIRAIVLKCLFCVCVFCVVRYED